MNNGGLTSTVELEKHIITLHKNDTTGAHNIQFIGDANSVREVHILRTYNLPNYTILNDNEMTFKNGNDYLEWISERLDKLLITGYTTSFETFDVDRFYANQSQTYDVRERIATV